MLATQNTHTDALRGDGSGGRMSSWGKKLGQGVAKDCQKLL